MTSNRRRPRLVAALVAGALAAGTAFLAAGRTAAAPAPAAPPPQPAAAPTAPTAAQLVQAYNQRNFGLPGWRRVHLQLVTDRQVTQQFTILHLFSRQTGQLMSLVVLEAPAGLRGTDYLLIEDPHEPTGMKLFLHLPAGQERPLAVVPSRFEEGLLGSDFAYSDLRWLIPTGGYRLVRQGAPVIIAGRRAWPVEAWVVAPEVRESSLWTMVRYYLGDDPPLLLGADFYRRGEPAPAKQLRVAALARRDGVWTPTRMVMRAGRDRSSVLTLGESRFGQGPADPGLFVPESLAGNAAHLLATGFGQPREMSETAPPKH